MHHEDLRSKKCISLHSPLLLLDKTAIWFYVTGFRIGYVTEFVLSCRSNQNFVQNPIFFRVRRSFKPLFIKKIKLHQLHFKLKNTPSKCVRCCFVMSCSAMYCCRGCYICEKGKITVTFHYFQCFLQKILIP